MSGLRVGFLAVLSWSLLAAPPPKLVAPTPPMGWNSYDAYDCAINEEQFRTTVDYMAANLAEYGWQYAVIDYVWFNPAPGNWHNPSRRPGYPDIRVDGLGRPVDKLAMDNYGRLLPAVERFPSAAGGQGFKPLADYVHGKGLKFGIHMMRGIPRQAYYENRPILGTQLTARIIGEPWDFCPWLNNMFGIDASKPGAQQYYDSVFKLYASWGVDFVKADDILYPIYHKNEVELIRKALDKCGRPMVLSLSPGEAPLSHAKHIQKNAQMWRISHNFWDDWDAIEKSFDLLNAWSSYIAPNSWPDADMLPIGHLSLGGRPFGPERMSHFTWPEHHTILSLWSICRSPLMIGGDLLSTPEETIALLKNKEVIAVNQSSENNRQVYKNDDRAAWIADIPGSEDKYLALFNLMDEKQKVPFVFEDESLRGKYVVRDLWSHQDRAVFEKGYNADLEPHGAGLYRLVKQ